MEEKMIKVFHNPNFTKRAFLSEEMLVQKVRQDMEKMELIAEVDSNSLDDAFNIMNEGDAEKVTILKETRSTSVGDILELNGIKYVVSSMGFEEVW